MKRIIYAFSLVIFAFTFANASHLSGGDIQYRYIGDSTGTAHHYEVFLRIYRDASGVNLGNTQNVTVTSSCNANISVSCNLVPGTGAGNVAPTLFDCVTPSASTKTLEIWAYRGTVILPGACADYAFYWSSCCRPPGITNIPASSGQGFYFEAKLNNFVGNNSSPLFISEPVRAFCVGNNFNWKQGVLETDGDSLHFSLLSCRELAGGPVDIPFNPGYTPTQPVTTTPTGPMTIHPKSGVINFTPAQQEIDVLAVLVEEFRYDSALYIWVPIGSSNRDMMIQIEPMCSPQAQAGVVLDYNAPGTYPDPISGLPTIDYNCLDSSVVMEFANKLDCSSISPDGTDFRLTAPTGQPIPVKEIISICDANNETKQLLLKLHKPLAVNGKYFLYSKIGNDGTTLLNKCGFPMAEFDTIQLNVQGCFNMQMDIKNVWIKNDVHPVVEWLADTSSYPNYLFDKFLIFRKDPGGSYQQIGQVINQYKNFYNDESLGATNVDADEYDYKVEMVLNNTAMGKTRSITSVLLESGGPNCDTVSMNWTVYDGWANPEYTVYYGEDDGMGGITWVADNTVPIKDTFYVFMLDPSKEAGNYKLKVEAIDPSATYTMVSNWTTCDKIVPPPPEPVDPIDPIVPNVFTPNNDGQNDLLTIDPLANWNTKRFVSIQNRWGVQVFETDMYDNSQAWNGTDKGGSDVADGVYFIVVDFEDQATGRTFKYTGTVTLIRNN